MLAMVTKQPAFTLDENEAQLLADNIANVAQHYDVSGVSEKGLAWYGIAQALAIVYGPRIMTVRNEANEKRKARQTRTPQDMASQQAPTREDGLPGAPAVDLSTFHGGGVE